MKSWMSLASLLLVLLLLPTAPADAQIFGKKKKKPAPAAPAAAKKTPKIKPYAEVITQEAVSDSGLFIVHRVEDKWYFEIPADVLEREILIVSRISGFVKNLNFGGAGMKSRPQQVIRWQRHFDNVLLRSVSYNSVANEDDPVYRSVRNNNFEPVVESFAIAAFNKDSSALVIDVTGLFTNDVPMIGALYPEQAKSFGIRGVDKNRSYVVHMKSFPRNTEVRHVLTYTGSSLPDNQLTGTLSIEMNQSFILLPEKPMMPRYYDARVGYFSLAQTDYSADEQRAASKRYITRWRLEPKDPEAFARGELVEPVQPIVYYIDPATPEKWRPYLKQGVDDWKTAFEAAGFRNAIMAKDAPTPEEDPDWHPEDVRYSVIRYITTDIQNAQGPHVHDPRTGEILESDILWYHNVMNLLRNWYFVQTAAANPAARGVKFEDAVMGQLIRFVAAHEVGHTLGLPHNMGSSYAYPVDSLRSVSFTSTFGTAPSIMDYARFNYVAQPEDAGVAMMPKIGPYDLYSIEWGYRPIPTATSPESERPTLNQWITRHEGNPLYRYGAQRGNPFDPTAQTEDLGDDAMLASDYGIRNLKRIVPQLITWTEAEGKDFQDLRELYGAVYGQLGNYMRHVATNVGGVFEHVRTYDENDVVYTPIAKERQQRAVAFLNAQLFATPEWLLDRAILQRIEPSGSLDRLHGFQMRFLRQLFEAERMTRLMEAEASLGAGAYTLLNLMDDTRSGIFAELRSGSGIDAYRRHLQRGYVDLMASIVDGSAADTALSDARALARANLGNLEREIRSGMARQTDNLSRYHLEDLLTRIDQALRPEK